VDADGAAFTETWRSAVERACASGLGDSSSD
jgi:hypothetical protein